MIYPSELPSSQHLTGNIFEIAGHTIRFLTHKPEQTFFTKQVHGTHILDSEHLSLNESSLLEADALTSSLPEHTLGVQTADCLPILLFDSTRKVAIHAGWRGLLGGILQKSIRLFEKPDRVYMVVGPHIFPYVVREDVIQVLLKGLSTLKEQQNCYTQISRDTYHLGLFHTALLFAT